MVATITQTASVWNGRDKRHAIIAVFVVCHGASIWNVRTDRRTRDVSLRESHTLHSCRNNGCKRA